MSNRLAPRWFTALLVVVGTAAACAGTAQAATIARPAHVGPPPGGYDGYGDQDGYGYHHHHHPNCNNDPGSGFAMSDFCPPSNNDPGYGYGYGGPDY